jgi:hypothetical protein
MKVYEKKLFKNPTFNVVNKYNFKRKIGELPNGKYDFKNVFCKVLHIKK